MCTLSFFPEMQFHIIDFLQYVLDKAGNFSRLVEVGMSYYCKEHDQNQKHDSQCDCKTYVSSYYIAVKKITMRNIYRLQHHFNHQKEWAVTLWYFMPVRLPYLPAVRWIDNLNLVSYGTDFDFVASKILPEFRIQIVKDNRSRFSVKFLQTEQSLLL